MKILNSCGNFSIRQDDKSNCVWLYWFDEPFKHLTINEYGDLELLFKTTAI